MIARFSALLLLTVLFVCFSMQPAHAACSDPEAGAGTMDYFTDANTFKFCNGTNWVDMGGTHIADPPVCSGAGFALQWDGADWLCDASGVSWGTPVWTSTSVSAWITPCAGEARAYRTCQFSGKRTSSSGVVQNSEHTYDITYSNSNGGCSPPPDYPSCPSNPYSGSQVTEWNINEGW